MDRVGQDYRESYHRVSGWWLLNKKMLVTKVGFKGDNTQHGMRGDGKGRIYTWGWKDGGWKATEEGKHSWLSHGESLVKGGGGEKEERKGKKTFPRKKWTEPGEWTTYRETTSTRTPAKGLGVTVTRWKTRRYTEVLRIRALGGWEGWDLWQHGIQPSHFIKEEAEAHGSEVIGLKSQNQSLRGLG